MKTKRLLILAFAVMIGVGAIAQEDFNTAQKAPQSKEVVIVKGTRTKKPYDNLQSAYKAALREAKQANPNKEVAIRNLSKGELKVNGDGSVSNYYNYTVVEIPGIVAQKMYVAIGKATCEIEEGNRFAIDKITITDDKSDKEKVKGEVVGFLIYKGYKVLAKEKLETLVKEQQAQQSGIYNDETTVKGGNFSAVGYLITVRITEEYVQIQIVDVSTGEYVGNVIENL